VSARLALASRFEALPAWLRSVSGYLATIALWCGTRIAHTRYLGWGSGYDANLFGSYARHWAAGQIPYVDFSPEYPPGSMLVFIAPLLFGGEADYEQAFAYEMAFFDLVSCLLVLAWARGLSKHRGRWFAARSVGLYLLLSTALFPVIFRRFDLAPATLAAAALFLAHKKREGLSAVLLGIAGAVKLWPFGLVPVSLVRTYRGGGWRRALATLGFTTLGVLLVLVPFWRSGTAVASFLQYHSQRGLQVASTWASIAFVLDLLGWVPAQVIHNYGAFHVEGPAKAYLVPISTAATLLAIVLPVVRGWYLGVGSLHDGDRELSLRVSTAVILGFLIGAKVLSPQFALWLVPFLPLAATSLSTALMSFLAALLTTIEYPYMSAALEMREPGHELAVLNIVSRNACLVALYVAMLRRPVARPSRRASQDA